MTTRTKVRYILLLLLGIAFGCAFNYAYKYAFILSAYNSKTVCSCHFVSGRELENIKEEEFKVVPYLNVNVDETLKTVTTKLFGFIETKAIYRKGLGCTLVNEISEEEIRKQPTISTNDSLVENITTEEKGIQQALKQVVDDTFVEKNPERLLQTRAVVVLQNGKIISEKYAKNITQNTPLIGWSMTKSVTNAMIGMMVKDGKLDIFKPAPIAEWQKDERKNITIDHLLRMSSGLDFDEIYTKTSDATTMLFRAKGAGAFAILSKAKSVPNEIWSYSSGTTNILQEMMRRQFSSHADYLNFPRQRLFQKIGMTSAVIEPDASGTFVGSSFMFATARDWAKFGQLYLQDGVWNNERILPEGWVKYSSTETAKSNGKYAAHFWLNHTDKDFPQDAFMALGFEGQSITVIPSKQMVVVRLGCTPNDDFDLDSFIKNIVKAVK